MERAVSNYLGGEQMRFVEALPKFVLRGRVRWWKWMVDSLLALGSISLITGFIFLLHAYSHVTDSFLIYLLVILALASTRGLYASLLASFLAFFSFDLLFVPPLYSLVTAKFEDVLVLIVFLGTAIVASKLTSALRERAENATRREREARILYELVRLTNREEDMKYQLHVFTRSVVEVFSSWGIRDCVLLLPDKEGTLSSFIGASEDFNLQELPSAELEMAVRAMKQTSTTIEVDDSSLRSSIYGGMILKIRGDASRNRSIRFVPLKIDEQPVAVLRLLIEGDSHLFPLGENGPGGGDGASSQAVFFSTFLEQAVTVIEQGRLRNEALHIKLLQQTDKLRSALLSSVSHDLRTPLSTIKTSVTSLLEAEMQWDDEARLGFLTAIEREVDRLNSLVENLLDMSRIEAGELHPEKVWYPLDELVLDTLDRMHSRLEERVVSVHFPDDLPPVELDYVQIDQVVTNLLENVISHTPADSPLDIRIVAQAVQLVVSIADRGPGIPVSECTRVFDKFYRIAGEAQTTSSTRGLGLGLAICRELVEAHSGRIWVEPRDGGGSVFCFTLPVSIAEGIEL
jgi:two-component system, OmpR family, sensor histidine kinase KdpD